MKTHTLRRSEHGFTMIELMIGMVIGLVIVLVVTQFMLSNTNTSKAQAGVSNIQENARFAFDLMSKQIRNAGYSPGKSLESFPSESSTNCANGTSASGHAICGVNDTGTNTSDTLIVRYLGINSPDGTAAEGGVRDCAGQAIADGTLIEERYEVKLVNDPTSTVANPKPQVPALICTVLTGAAVGTTAVPTPNGTGTTVELLQGVDRMQILYGYARGSTTGVTKWEAGSATGDMENVRAVRIALLLRDNALTPTATTDTATYNFFGPEYSAAGDAGATLTSPNDTRIRRLYSFTATVRNRM